MSKDHIKKHDPVYYLNRPGELPFSWNKPFTELRFMHKKELNELPGLIDSAADNNNNKLITKEVIIHPIESKPQDNNLQIIKKESDFSLTYEESIDNIQRKKTSDNDEQHKQIVTDERQSDVPFLPFVEGKYSLECDMMFGWVPNIEHGAPIPLKFTDYWTDEIIFNATMHRSKHKSQLMSKNHKDRGFSPSVGNECIDNVDITLSNISNKKGEIIYLGFRPKDSFEIHKEFSSLNTYFLKFSPLLFSKYDTISKYLKTDENTFKRPFIGMNPKLISTNNNNNHHQSIIFDSKFEGGNLDAVLQVGEYEYDCYMRVDTNTKGHTNWFYFKVMNHHLKAKIKINIMNFVKYESLYKKGMKPYIYSEKANYYSKQKWIQNGENVIYKAYHIEKIIQDNDNDNDNDNNNNNDYEIKKKKFYKLSFYYTFEYEDDIVSFATCIPYTYTDLLKFIRSLTSSNNPNEENHIAKQSKLCMSLGGVDIPLLKITDHKDTEIPLEQRQCVIITGRVHPGETNASWMMQGFLNFICGETNEAKFLRKRIIFQVVPMLNPDGVIIGNHRTGFCGMDLNRQFLNTNEKLHPCIDQLKKLIIKIRTIEKMNILAFIDFHGHLLNKGAFMYGADYPVHHENYYKTRIIPKLIAKNTEIFRFQSCIFRISKPKYGTSRAVFSMQYDISNCYTLEASFGSYLTLTRETVNFTDYTFQELGRFVGYSLFDYLTLLDEAENLKAVRKKQKETERLKKNYGNNLNTTESSLSPILRNPKLNLSSLRNSISPSGIPINKDSKGFSDRLTKMNIIAGYSANNDISPAKNSNSALIGLKKDSFKLRRIKIGGGYGESISAENSSIKDKYREKKKDQNENTLTQLIIANKKAEDKLKCRLLDIIQEIKDEETHPKSINHNNSEEEIVPEGNSDTESDDENFDEQERKMLNHKILKRVEIFCEYIKSNKKPLFEYVKMHFKKKQANHTNITFHGSLIKKPKKPDTAILIHQLYERSKKSIDKIPFVHVDKKPLMTRKTHFLSNELKDEFRKSKNEFKVNSNENYLIKNMENIAKIKQISDNAKKYEKEYESPTAKILIDQNIWENDQDRNDAGHKIGNKVSNLSVNQKKRLKRMEDKITSQKETIRLLKLSKMSPSNSNNGLSMMNTSMQTRDNTYHAQIIQNQSAYNDNVKPQFHPLLIDYFEASSTRVISEMNQGMDDEYHHDAQLPINSSSIQENKSNSKLQESSCMPLDDKKYNNPDKDDPSTTNRRAISLNRITDIESKQGSKLKYNKFEINMMGSNFPIVKTNMMDISTISDCTSLMQNKKFSELEENSNNAQKEESDNTIDMNISRMNMLREKFCQNQISLSGREHDQLSHDDKLYSILNKLPYDEESSSIIDAIDSHEKGNNIIGNLNPYTNCDGSEELNNPKTNGKMVSILPRKIQRSYGKLGLRSEKPTSLSNYEVIAQKIAQLREDVYIPNPKKRLQSSYISNSVSKR